MKSSPIISAAHDPDGGVPSPEGGIEVCPADIDVVDPAGRAVRVTYQVQSVDGDVVTFTETTSDPDGAVLRVDRASLRFLGIDALAQFLAEAEFVIEVQHGGWYGEAVELTSAEIVTFARKP